MLPFLYLFRQYFNKSKRDTSEAAGSSLLCGGRAVDVVEKLSVKKAVLSAGFAWLMFDGVDSVERNVAGGTAVEVLDHRHGQGCKS